VEREGVSSSVTFAGRVPDELVAGAFAIAEVAVVPSRALEGYGLIVREALACGTPSIVTDVGGLPEAISDVDESLVVAHSTEAISNRLAAALRFGELPSHERCVEVARARTWGDVAAEHIALYRQLGPESPGTGRRKVVFVGHTSELGGAEIALLHVVPALERSDPHVILGEDGELARRLERSGISVECMRLSPSIRSVRRSGGPMRFVVAAFGVSCEVIRLARRFRKISPDVVHANSTKAGLYAGLAAQIARRPFVWQLRDRLAADYFSTFAVKALRLFARLIPDLVIANSETTRATLPRQVRSVVIRSPVGIPESPAATAPPMHSGFRVGILGRLAPWKGQDLFLRAFAQAAREVPSATAVVIGGPAFGEDRYFEALRAMAELLQISEIVDFRGFRWDVGRELARLDALVHASVIPEPFGQVVAQGMALSLPVIAPSSGGPAELIEDGRTGLLYPMGDERSLAEAIVRLARDSDERARLGRAAKSAVASLSPALVAAEIEAAHSAVLTRVA
jgi:glycosyltransferase involved in cell wall biosynthesis